MGAECSCVKHDNEQEYVIGSGAYGFKKFVCNEIIKNNFKLLLYIVQYLPKNENQKIYYAKDGGYDKDVKNKIDRTSSLIRNGVKEYTNGNVEVIVPCLDSP